MAPRFSASLQRFEEFAAVGEAIVRLLGQSAAHHAAFEQGQRIEQRRSVQVLVGELCGVSSSERQCSGEHFLIDDRQGILVAVTTRSAFEDLRRRVRRRQSVHRRIGPSKQVLDQSEVPDFDAIADEQQVAGLDVQVLQIVFLAEVVKPMSGIRQILEQ